MNIAVAQSGGPTCAINASLVGVFRESLKEPAIDAIFGSVNGVEGIIQDHLIDLKTMIRTNEDMELLRQTPSTVLGSCRYKLPDYHEDSSVYEKIAAVLKRRKIGAFFYIGDADVGARVNVGAGTITCNYDGVNKFRTVIGDDAFIGSDTQLIAPVEVGAGATIGAGTTLTRNAPAGKLTLSRARQMTIEGWTRPVKKQ